MGFTCPFPGAGWRRIFYFAKYFEKMGYNCRILSCFSPSSFNVKKVVREEGISIYNMIPYIPVNNPFLLFINNFFALVASFPFFILFRPSSIIISIPPVDQLLPVLMLSKIMRCELVIDYRDEFEEYLIMHTGKWSFFYRLLKRVLPYFYKSAILITPVTPAVAENLKKRDVYNIKVIYDGVDTETFHPLNKNKIRSEFRLPQDSFIIIYLGNVYDPYRVDIVIRALKKLKEREPKRKYLLLLVGGGNVKNILNLANNLGVNDAVKYFGIVKNTTEVVKILNSGDCGIIPYDDNPLWQRTYSTKLFEYCAVGLPVIVTVHEDSALATVIRANKIGLVAPPVDVDALASSLETLSNNKELRNKMSLSALLFAQTYDKEKLARDLLETIERISTIHAMHKRFRLREKRAC
jgi:glycosyltransferase involved in cell wall biosynthesis